MSEPKHIIEARDLLERTKAARRQFPFRNDFTESEVEFRYSAIQGILTMALNDVHEMLRQWCREV